ncbi:hypothetical protein T02_9728 [Trichinella nativa]|uniref:Uncharacterized protein n=2 Tax=Trichinella TaxID=6333 RepID=A0A0V1KVL0_9BILA|nr:hypothetical protein T12_4063 [Trichinella patagoniensis]KRZ51338.1 hypothetical protein T02_9728 [Trichinella nativa]
MKIRYEDNEDSLKFHVKDIGNLTAKFLTESHFEYLINNVDKHSNLALHLQIASGLLYFEVARTSICP